MNRKQRDLCEAYGIGVFDDWDASPLDARKSLLSILVNGKTFKSDEQIVEDILVALGVPRIKRSPIRHNHRAIQAQRHMFEKDEGI